MLTPGAIHLAERDGQLAAIRLLYALRWHLDAHDTSEDSEHAAVAFLDGFCDVFANQIDEAWPDGIGPDPSDGFVGPVATLYRAIARDTPDLIQRLDR